MSIFSPNGSTGRSCRNLLPKSILHGLAILLVLLSCTSIFSQDAPKSSAAKPRKARPGFRFISAKSDIQYKMLDTGDGYSSHGHRLLKVQVYNGESTPQKVQLRAVGEDIEQWRYYGITALKSVTGTTVSLEPDSLASLKVFLPNVFCELEKLELIVNDSVVELRLVDVSHITSEPLSRMNLSDNSATILIGSPGVDAFKLEKELQDSEVCGTVNSFGSYGYYGGSGGPMFMQNLELRYAPSADLWDDEWISYTSYTAIVVNKPLYDLLPQNVKTAVRQYVAAGGTLVFTEMENLPPEYSSAVASEPRKLKYRNYLTSGIDLPSDIQVVSFGLGVVGQCEPAVGDWEITPSGRSKLLGVNWEALTNTFMSPTFHESKMAPSTLRRLSLFEEQSVNLSLVFWGVFGFISLIGPLNFIFVRFYLRNMMALIVTTPVVSIIVCLLFVIGDYFSQGTTATTITESSTLLDQVNRTAVSIGNTGIYTPIRAGELKVDRDTEFYAVESDSEQTNSVTASLSDSHMNLLTGWVSPRKQLFFSLRQAARTDLRIQFEMDENGTPVAINGLGVKIEKLLYHHPTLGMLKANEIASGASASLENTTGRTVRPKRIPVEVHSLLVSPVNTCSVLEDLFNKESIAPGHYIAVTEASAFLKPLVENSNEKKTSSYVYGITGAAK